MPFFDGRFPIIYEALNKDKQRFDSAKQWLFIWGMKDEMCACKSDQILPETQIIKVDNAKHVDIVQKYCIEQYEKQLIAWLKQS